jgi:two-component system chemotaxis response regulator CheB
MESLAKIPRKLKAVVTIGASAGGVQALMTLLQQLPDTLEAAVFVVLHIPAHTPSQLPAVLQRATRMPVAFGKDGEEIRAGRVYLAQADRHLMIDGNKIRVTRGPKESRARPSIDVLFRSAAISFGPQVIGVVLTGALDDGTAGLWTVKDMGGKALVQDPNGAEYRSMPESAAAHVEVDATLSITDLAKEISRLTQEGLNMAKTPPRPGTKMENMIAAEGNALNSGVMTLGRVSGYTCPDCHGALVQIEEGSIVRFRCHTGHAFSLKALLVEVSESIDTGLWDTLRAIEERIMLLKQMAEIASKAGSIETAASCRQQASDAEIRIKPIRELVLDPTFFGHGPEEP